LLATDDEPRTVDASGEAPDDAPEVSTPDPEPEPSPAVTAEPTEPAAPLDDLGELEEFDGDDDPTDDDPVPTDPLTAALEREVALRLASEEGGGGGLEAQCPTIDRFVAGDLIACDLSAADGEDLAPDTALVSVHDSDGTHVALPWEGSGAPPTIDEVTTASGGSGQFCRDVNDAGFDYQAAVAYWYREGSPGRMDAAGDGIPCGTVYDSEEIDRYWEAVRTAQTP